MYEYGCFTSFWSNFELMMEVAIWMFSDNDPKKNCKDINPKTAGQKKNYLSKILLEQNQQQINNALTNVFSVADRNGWIHGHILNPGGDFSRFTRLRIEKNINGDITVNNAEISFDISPFNDFYDAYGQFEVTSGASTEKCNEYITLLQRNS